MHLPSRCKRPSIYFDRVSSISGNLLQLLEGQTDRRRHLPEPPLVCDSLLIGQQYSRRLLAKLCKSLKGLYQSGKRCGVVRDVCHSRCECERRVDIDRRYRDEIKTRT